jgi:hypothetical protein
MRSVEQLIRSVKIELADEFYQRLYKQLMERDKQWLVEELIKLIAKQDDVSLGRQLLSNLQDISAATDEQARIRRIMALQLTEEKVQQLVEQFKSAVFTRTDSDEYLLNPPPKGGEPIHEQHRTQEGHALLEFAKDVLYGLLYGTKEQGVAIKRVEHEILSIVVPRHKAYAFSFLRTVTEIASLGTWRDPKNEASDDHASNIILEVQYGEAASECVGDGIIACLKLINELEVNEKILYAHMRNVEQSSLDIE